MLILYKSESNTPAKYRLNLDRHYVSALREDVITSDVFRNQFMVLILLGVVLDIVTSR
jgi:hypothetical protein